MTGPLEGIRCLEWGVWHNGVAAGAMFGDLGAEVVKIEEPQKGDPSRGIDSLFGISMHLPAGRNAFFEASNRNKKSITLNLKHQKGKEIAYRLVKKADVFYTNFRRGAADRLGFDYQSLSRYNSRLIYARASTYGPKGAEVDTRGFDWVGQARSGMMMAGAGDGDPPFVMTGGMVDQAGAIALAYGVLVALVARDRLGVGQEVDTSLIGSALWLQYISLTSYLLRGKEMKRHDRTRAVNPLGNVYRCADGKWLALIEVQTDRFWGDFCRALGAENLTEDPRFGDVKGRRQHKEALIVILDQIFATKTRDDWVKVLRNYQFAYAPISTIPEMVSDPQVLANDYIVEMDHPDLGRTKVVGLPITLSHSQGMVKNPAPQLGQHTEEVLLDWGGYSWEEISSFREEGVI